jgi:quinohemoprotein ethanol dehydrogenase
MQAPKNGFFYVLDRETGELLSAEKYVPVTWAERVDLATGRPVEAPGARYGAEPKLLHPGPAGGHGWAPMSFHPGTGLVYVPTLEMPFAFADDPSFTFHAGHFNTGIDSVAGTQSMGSERVVAALVAWDPRRQREVWRVEHPYIANGGVLSTAGNLIFQGTGRATLAAYRASDGERLFEAFTGTGVVAPPITYRVDGEQYVAVLAGLGGGMALASADPPPATLASGNAGRLLAFKLGAKERLPEPALALPLVIPIEAKLDPAQVAHGEQIFYRYCSTCHGPGAIGGGTVPDLRRSPPAIYDELGPILLQGARLDGGMPSFGAFLRDDDVSAVRAYLIERRAELVREESARR